MHFAYSRENFCASKKSRGFRLWSKSPSLSKDLTIAQYSDAMFFSVESLLWQVACAFLNRSRPRLSSISFPPGSSPTLASPRWSSRNYLRLKNFDGRRLLQIASLFELHRSKGLDFYDGSMPPFERFLFSAPFGKRAFHYDVEFVTRRDDRRRPGIYKDELYQTSANLSTFTGEIL
jgi:hypothetical protein